MAVEQAGSCCHQCWSGWAMRVRGWQLLSQVSCDSVHLFAVCISISCRFWVFLFPLLLPHPTTFSAVSSALGFLLPLCQAPLSPPARCSPYPICHTFIMYVPFLLAAISASQTAPTVTAAEDKSVMLLFDQAGGNSYATCVSWAMDLRKMVWMVNWAWILGWTVCQEWLCKELKFLSSLQGGRDCYY